MPSNYPSYDYNQDPHSKHNEDAKYGEALDAQTRAIQDRQHSRTGGGPAVDISEKKMLRGCFLVIVAVSCYLGYREESFGIFAHWTLGIVGGLAAFVLLWRIIVGLAIAYVVIVGGIWLLQHWPWDSSPEQAKLGKAAKTTPTNSKSKLKQPATARTDQ